MRTHPRVCLSMLSQWNWTVDEDLAYFDREGVEVIGVSLAKMQDGGGWDWTEEMGRQPVEERQGRPPRLRGRSIPWNSCKSWSDR